MCMQAIEAKPDEPGKKKDATFNSEINKRGKQAIFGKKTGV